MLTDEEIATKIHRDPDWLRWQGQSLYGFCSHCRRNVDNHDEAHRVTPIMDGGRGVECTLRGDIHGFEAQPLGRRW